MQRYIIPKFTPAGAIVGLYNRYKKVNQDERLVFIY